MSRTGYLTGGIRHRLRDALAAIPSSTCDLRSCDLPAAALLRRDGGLPAYGFVCAGHAIQAEKLGYPIIRPGGDS